jgi:hypothetical protein
MSPRLIVAATLLATAAAAPAADRTPLPKGAQRCVSAQTGVTENLTLLDPSRVTVRVGSKKYVSTFRGGACPGGNDKFATLIVESFSGPYCEGDHVRLLSPPQTIPGPVCILGPFLPYQEPAKPAR